MNLVYLAAVIAVCAAAKLDRTYLPPASATTAGGTAEDIQTPLVRDSFNRQSDFPKGAYENEFEGVVVEAVAPGTRASSSGETGLGSPRISYGSEHSKVGGAAFKKNENETRAPVEKNVRDDQVESQTLVNFQQGLHTDLNKAILRPQSALERVANIIRYENNRGSQNYYYVYETENGITAEESGNLNNGVQAEGGYSYIGDDGKLYKVTYTAGEGGYQPSGDHLPTPPPIPDEILRSLEQNARDAAAGLIDDGSYDAAKYNTGDDYTKNDSSLDDDNNSRQPISFYKPEFGAEISGPHTNQNAQTFENINVSEKITSPNYNTPKVGSKLDYFPNNKLFIPTTTGQSGTQNIFANENRDDINDKKETSNDESSSDEEYSRPIYFGLTKPNQEINNVFGKRPYSTSINSIIKPTVSLNSANSITGSQAHSESFPGYQFNKFSQNYNTVVPTQSSSQFVNGYPNNMDLIKESNVQSEAQNNIPSLNNVHSTILPSAELTTPFENTPDTNRQEYISQNVPQSPTQASFSTLTTFDSQSYNGGQSILGTSQNNESFQLNKVMTQQGFQQLIDTDKTKINGAPQISENSYFYNQPSKPFNTIKATASTVVTGNSHFTNDYKDSISTKYPRPPTIAPIPTNPFIVSMQNQYSDGPQIPSFGSHLRPFTKYPQPPVISHIVPSPTSPTSQIGNKLSTQYAGITQASVSPFPSTSMTFVGSNSKLQQPVTSLSNTYHQQASLGQAFNRGNAGNQEQAQLNSQSLSNQQYDGEIYEYKKPEESLPSPNKSDESDVIKSTNDFSQFGQKIQPSMLNRPLLVGDQNESNSKDESQSIQNTPPVFDSQNLLLNLNLQEANVIDKQTLMGHSGNVQTFGQEPTTQKFSYTALQGSQPTVEYNNPFEFSSRIRPCCQGTKTSTTGKDMHNDFNKPMQQTGQDQSEFNSPQFGFQDQQNPQATSQFQTGNGEEFSGSRRPPNFDEASGYHY